MTVCILDHLTGQFVSEYLYRKMKGNALSSYHVVLLSHATDSYGPLGLGYLFHFWTTNLFLN